jgi:hypothetical protein
MSSDFGGGVSAAVSAASNSSGGSVQTAVLGSVMQLQASNMNQLIQSAANAVPQPPLATSGNLGTRLNTYA